MSTKIYTGFKFKSSNIFEIFAELKSIREKAKVIMEESLSELIAVRSTTLLDRYCYFKEKFKKPPSPVVDTWLELVERIKRVKQTNLRDPEVDFDFEVCVIPHGTEFLGIYFTEQKILSELLTTNPLFQDYAYWDNTDPDPNVTEEEWGVREATWEAALSNRAIKFSSLTYSIIDSALDLPNPDAKQVLTKVPTLKKRLNTLVKDLMFQDFVRSKNITLDSSNVANTYREFDEWLQTEAGARSKELREEGISKHLVLNVTTEDLLGEG